ASDFKDGEVVVYYTVTDRYGKSSAPVKLAIEVAGLPDAPVIYEQGSGVAEDAVRSCGGEVRLRAAASAAAGFYRWAKDGEEIVGETGSTLQVNTAGVYTVWIFNEANCSTGSQEVKIDYPELPEVLVEERIVSCGVGEVDLRLFIAAYDDALYDYEVTAPHGHVLEPGDLGSFHD